MREKLTNLKEKFLLLPAPKKLLIVGLSIIFLGSIGVLLFYSGKSKSETLYRPGIPPQTTTSTTEKGPSSPQKLPQTILPAPKVSFATYENTAGLPTLPATVNLYTLKTDFPMDGVIALGKELGLTDYKVFGENVLLYNTSAGSAMGMMTFNRRTGTFAYQSFAVGSTEIMANPNPTQVARSFLQRVGLDDNTITCEITYERTDLPDQTFVECHRDWEKTGLPILSSLGVINVAESQPLKQLVLGGADPSFPDPAITNVSTGQNGLARPTDFNSATIVVSTDGTVISASSNIRPIQQTQSYNTAQLLSPQDALQEFQNQKSELSLTVPAGAGTPDVAKVYPNNTASSPKATITDYVLVYTENPPDVVQGSLTPMYLIRGTSQLSSGFRIKFTQILPAVKNVAGAYTQLAQANGSLKLGTFQPTINPTVTFPTPTRGTVQITSTPTNSQTPLPTGSMRLPPSLGQCNPDQSELNPIYQVNGLTYGLGTLTFSGKKAYPEAYLFIYYIPPWTLSFDPKLSAHSPADAQQRLAEINRLLSEIETITSHLKTQIGTQKLALPTTPTSLFTQRDNLNLFSDFYLFTVTGKVCPLRVSGGSPTIFLYGKPGTEVSIRVNHHLTYSDPSARQNNWNVVLKADGKLAVDKREQPYLYYEYEPVSFSKPDQGWIVRKSELANFVARTLSPQLALLPAEADRLIFELNHAAFSIDSDTLFISPIDQKEVDEKLPLSTSPKPEIVTRLHFYVQGQDHFTQVGAPALSPVERREFMILELGATMLYDNAYHE